MRKNGDFTTLVLLVAIAAIAPLVIQNYYYGRGTPQIVWSRSLSEAVQKASHGERLIVADVFTDWCGWCKEMDRTTWIDPAVVREGRSHVFLKVNAETEPDGIAIQKKFNIQSYPTVLLLDARGDEFDRIEGYLPGPRFLQKLRDIVADADSLGNLKISEAGHPEDLSVRLKLARKFFARYSFDDARSRLEKIITADPENKGQFTDSALFYLALCQASVKETDESLRTIDRLRARFPESKMAPNSLLLSGEIMIQLGKKTEARSRIQDFLKSYPDHQLVEQARKLLAGL